MCKLIVQTHSFAVQTAHDDIRRQKESCTCIHSHKQSIDRAEMLSFATAVKNEWCVTQPRQRQTMTMYQTMAGGVGKRV
jgi:preprotein translocase subunit Sec63